MDRLILKEFYGIMNHDHFYCFDTEMLLIINLQKIYLHGLGQTIKSHSLIPPSFPGFFLKLRRPNQKGKSPGNEIE